MAQAIADLPQQGVVDWDLPPAHCSQGPADAVGSGLGQGHYQCSQPPLLPASLMTRVRIHVRGPPQAKKMKMEGLSLKPPSLGHMAQPFVAAALCLGLEKTAGLGPTDLLPAPAQGPWRQHPEVNTEAHGPCGSTPQEVLWVVQLTAPAGVPWGCYPSGAAGPHTQSPALMEARRGRFVPPAPGPLRGAGQHG